MEVTSLDFQVTHQLPPLLYRPGTYRTDSRSFRNPHPASKLKEGPLRTYKKKMKLRVKHLQKEFSRDINIADRRFLSSRSGPMYEYLWEFAGVSCWKPLEEHEHLFELYLCQVRCQHAPVLKFLPSELSQDLSHLIYKIEGSFHLSRSL
jgi:hypothetical protein